MTNTAAADLTRPGALTQCDLFHTNPEFPTVALPRGAESVTCWSWKSVRVGAELMGWGCFDLKEKGSTGGRKTWTGW